MATDFTTQINAPFQAVAGQNDPSAGDVATLNAELNSGTTLAQADVQIVNEPFFTTDVDPVVRLFQAAFGRVPDAAGLKAEVQALIASGGNVSAIASAFANSSEFLARYGAVATTPENPALVLALYTNVLGRAPDAAGLAFWDAQTSLNAAQLLVDFSQSSEFQTDTNAYVKSYEFDVAANSNNGGAVAPATGSLFAVPLNAGNTGGAPTTNVFTLTPGTDTFTTSNTATAGGNTFNALVNFNAPSGTFFDTLNTGDSIQVTGTGNVLNAAFAVVAPAAGAPGGPPANGVIVQGVQTWNLSSTSGATIQIDGVGGTANITGLTTLNVSNSSAGSNFVVGGLAAGNGVGSLLSTIGLTNDTDNVTAWVAAANLVAGSTLAVNASGVGTLGVDEVLRVGPDSGNVGYATWSIATAGTNFLQIGANNGAAVTTATTLNVSGSGSLQLDGDASSWTKIKTLSLANETGNVFITGADAGGYTVNGAGGLLTGNTALTSYTGGSGNDIVDLSSLSTANLQAMTTLNGGTGTTETAILGNAVSESAAASANVISNLTNFQVVGLAAGHTGTVTMANFPGATTLTDYGNSGGNQIVTATGLSTFTFNTNGFSETAGVLTINGPATGSNTLNVQVGGNGFFETAASNSNITQLIDNGFGIANISSVGPVGGANTIYNNSLAETFTAPVGQTMTVNISGTDALNTNGLQLFGNGTSIVDTSTAVLNIDDFIGGVAGAFSTNAANINASTSGGLSMEGGDSNTVGTAGDIITGSLTKANILVGSVGNDQLTVGTAGGDNIWTNGGGDVIALGAGHAKTDTIFLTGETGNGSFAAQTTLLGGQTAVAGSINNAGVTQAGFFGNAPGATGATASTSADQSVVSNFVAGTGATADTVNFSVGAWKTGGTYDGLLDANLATNAVAGNAVIVSVVSGGTITSVTASLIELTGATFANAAAVATALNTGSFGLTFSGAGTATHTGDVLVGYQDTAGNTHIADVAISEVGGGGTEAAAGHVSAASDLVQLTGVSLASFAANGNNMHFIA